MSIQVIQLPAHLVNMSMSAMPVHDDIHHRVFAILAAW
jgi:hypothetical protein